MEKLAIACDHAGYELKLILKEILQKDFEMIDFGTNSLDSCDYPDYVHPFAKSIESKECNRGVLICGTANGVAITANKYKGIRAGIAWAPALAELTRQHNDANVICIPARFVSTEIAVEILNAFLHTDFEGGRHQNRVDKIAQC